MMPDFGLYDLLIVGDLHLSEGRNRHTGRMSRKVDFLFDEEFARFLKYHSNGMSSGAEERKRHLVVNGDFLYFLQVTSTDLTSEFKEYLTQLPDGGRAIFNDLSQSAPMVLTVGPDETVYKLWIAMDGHRVFFEALADFLAEDNRVSIGRGNSPACAPGLTSSTSRNKEN